MIMGQHLLIECRGQHAMLGSDDLKALMTRAAAEGGATVLVHHFHEFGGHGGITGVLVLAESHITVHTWPEVQYAAFDIFMCGDAQPMKAARIIVDQFPDAEVCIKAVARGYPSETGINCTISTPNVPPTPAVASKQMDALSGALRTSTNN
ncbi:MAG: adenosylmethionine decarboxylase [Porticoccaceae bacterium]|nr:MAG: adenosylmethionine decarboxylase [Porticoccaceae bacterium]